ncbi:MAG: virulence protein RhuM/Fic/DOC family protein [Bacteroidales bacterium]|nr:virulence protein RhuM/Fic/DOC family protein [Bacteroidales bacterium]
MNVPFELLIAYPDEPDLSIYDGIIPDFPEEDGDYHEDPADSKGKIILYQTPDGSTSIDVKLENDTVWLTQSQMAELFHTTKQNISLHIRNAFKEGELVKEEVVKDFLTTTAHGAIEGKTQTHLVSYYNLDVIISIGYRVHSPVGVHFRRWANSVLKDYLIKGFAVRDNLVQERYDDLRTLVEMMGRTMSCLDNPTRTEISSVFDVVKDYTYALDTLDSYDYQTLKIENTSGAGSFHATYENAMEVINGLKEKFGESSLFGNEKDESFHSSIGQIYQTWDGVDLYPSVEEKAAMLLYLVTKNHSFSDGNKRIAATLFLWFMEKNGILYGRNGEKRIGDNALVALTLMIAESKTEEMDIIIKVVVNLINKNNS